MDLQWTVYVQQVGTGELTKVGSVGRPIDGASVADFGLSIPEGRALLASLQQVLAQDQVLAYDERRRRCRHCGAYRRIKDWRPRSIATGLGQVEVRVPRVVSCLCTPEPLDEDDEPINLRFTECPIDPVLPRSRTLEAHTCAPSMGRRPAIAVLRDRSPTWPVFATFAMPQCARSRLHAASTSRTRSFTSAGTPAAESRRVHGICAL